MSPIQKNKNLPDMIFLAKKERSVLDRFENQKHN